MNSTTRSKVFALLFSFGLICLSALCAPTASAAGNVHNVSDATIQELLLMVPSGRPLVVEFYDSTASDASDECSKQKPIFEKVAADYAGKATFVRLDISKARAFAESGRFTVCPSHLFLDQEQTANRIARRHWGLLTEQQFHELLKEYFNV